MAPRKKDLPALPDISVPENIGDFLTQYEESLSNDENVLWDGVNHSLRVELFSYIDSGIKLKKLKEITEHGLFLKRLSEYDISIRNAQNRIAVATKFCQLKKIKYATVAHFGISKILELIKWGDNEITAFSEGEEVRGLTIDEAHTMSKREFIATVKDHEAENNDLQQELLATKEDLDDAEEELLILKKQLAGQSIASEWPIIVDEARNESTAMAEQCLLCVDDFNRLVTQVSETPLSTVEEVAAYSAMYHNLAAVVAKASEALGHIQDTFPGESLNTDDSIIQLSSTEVEIAVKRRRLLTQQHLQEQMIRAQKRQEKRPKAPGRPKSFKVPGGDK